MPADLVNHPPVLPSNSDDIPDGESGSDEATPVDQVIAISWVVEIVTYRADEPIESRSERLSVYADTSSLTEGSLPFDIAASAPVAVWPSGAAVTDAADGVVSVEVWINTTPTSGAPTPATPLTVDVTIAEGRVVASKVLP